MLEETLKVIMVPGGLELTLEDSRVDRNGPYAPAWASFIGPRVKNW